MTFLLTVLKLGFGGLGTGLFVYVGLCGLLLIGQRQLIFAPSPVLEITPLEAGIDHQEVWIPVDDSGDIRIHGWWLPALGEPTGKTLLYLHGNAGNIGDNLGLAHRFQRLGLSVLLVDYRGYGLSSGPSPSEARMYEDAAIAWRHLRETKRIPAQDIVIFGHSIGGAVAIELAHSQPDAAGLIVKSTFSSMYAMADRIGYTRWFPVNWILTQRFDSLSKVRDLQVPVLFIHGLADQSVPADMTMALYGATPDPKELWQVPEADHNDVADVAGAEYDRRIRQFLDTLSRVESSL